MDDFGSIDPFDDFLASMEMPTPHKIQKLEEELEKPTTSKDAESKTVLQPPVSVLSSKTTVSNLEIAGLNVVKSAKTSGNNPHCILVHAKQRGNPLLKCISTVPLEYRDDIVPDYVVGRTSCVLFLSLKYHNLNPDYICQRIKVLGKMYELRVLLVQVDTPEPHNALKSLTRISLLADLTLILAWNANEAAKIIETYKQFENRPPDLIMERVDSNPYHMLVSALTHIKPINKTDAITLLQNFGSLENMINASEDRLSQVMGLGPRKAKKLYKTLHEPFLGK